MMNAFTHMLISPSYHAIEYFNLLSGYNDMLLWTYLNLDNVQRYDYNDYNLDKKFACICYIQFLFQNWFDKAKF